MSQNIVGFEMSMNSALENLIPENWNAEPWNYVGDQLQHSLLTKGKKQIDETPPFGRLTVENGNCMEYLDTSPVLPKTASMLQETPVRHPTVVLQESLAIPTAAPISKGQDLCVPLIKYQHIQLEPIPHSFNVADWHVAYNRLSGNHCAPCYQETETAQGNLLKQFQEVHEPFIPGAPFQLQETLQIGHHVQNGYGVQNICQYFPPYRGEGTRSALSVVSANAEHKLTLTAPEMVSETPNSAQVTGAQVETDPRSLSQEHVQLAARMPLSIEAGGSDVQVLATYNLEGFRHSKVLLRNPEECSHCNDEFPNLRSLRDHIKRSHGDTFPNMQNSKAKLKCHFCDALLMNETNLRRHIKNVHNQGKKKFSCEVCSAFFNSSFAAITHMRDIHGIQPASRQKAKGKRWVKKVFFRCETCGYCSKEKSNVTRHVRSAHLRKKIAKTDQESDAA